MNSATDRKESAFISVTSWILIVLTGVMVLITALQSVLVWTVFPVEQMKKSFDSPQGPQQIPVIFKTILMNIRIIVPIFLAISIFMFTAAINLLKRKNWARVTFICLLSLGIIWNFIGLGFQLKMMSSMPTFPSSDQGPNPKVFFGVMKGVSVILSLGISALYGWVIKKLNSSDIKREFNVQIGAV